MTGLDMFLLRSRLQDAGYDVYQFSYPSLKQSPRENAADLQEFLQNVPGETVHFVCHSLGGLVIRHLLHDYPDLRPGRVVTLGTPHQPSSAALQLEK
jgi:pimeloyl-ACP methyl ester carboxylesterase